MMDVWGRAEAFLLMVICATIGLVLMATCHSFEIYCAANVSLMTPAIPLFFLRVLIATGFLLRWLLRNGIRN